MVSEKDRAGYTIDTASGVRLDLERPRAEDIRIDDIAGGLSRVCRLGAQAREFFSVAQHALLVSDLVREAGREDLALVALHHDSHEAYLCDIPKPLKRKMSSETDVYERTCDAVDKAICSAFGFEWPAKGSSDYAAIKEADGKALLMEARRLLADGGRALALDHGFTERESAPLEPLPEPLAPTAAEAAFHARHREIAGYLS